MKISWRQIDTIHVLLSDEHPISDHVKMQFVPQTSWLGFCLKAQTIRIKPVQMIHAEMLKVQRSLKLCFVLLVSCMLSIFVFVKVTPVLQPTTKMVANATRKKKLQ